MTKKCSVSFVIPVYKSEGTIERLINEINDIKEIDWEVVLVNDNSPDNVDVAIQRVIRKYPDRINYLKLRKNSGQQVATINGFKYSTKEYVATIDDDGQNPPKEILKMLKVMIDYDYDVVYGVLDKKKHSYIRNVVSKINKFVSVIAINNKKGIPVSSVRLFKKDIANSIANFSGNFNYIEGLVFSLTDYVGQVNIDHRERQVSKSNYNFKKLFGLCLNHVIGYSNFLIKLVSLFSFIVAILSFLFGLVYLILTVNNQGRPSGWLSTYLTVTLLFCMTFMILGIVSEYIGRIYSKLNNVTSQIIKKSYLHDEKKE